jgi:hypothetical protein
MKQENQKQGYKISIQEIVGVLTQKAIACDNCEVNFVVSSNTMYNMWCLLWQILC